jgi:hypothetical protein
MDDEYLIRVQGRVGPRTLEELGLDACVETVLRGTITDDAALHGVLNRIQELGLRLVEVRRSDIDHVGR